MAAVELGRVNVAARAVGLATCALEQAIAYANQRETFGKVISQHQAIQLKIAQMATRLRAAELLVFEAAQLKATGARADLEAGMAKLFATETAIEVATDAMRIHGGYGYSQEYMVERLYRDAPLLILGEGSNEIQQLLIAGACSNRPHPGTDGLGDSATRCRAGARRAERGNHRVGDGAAAA
jgi:butyryl-CoA dehydrogenase